MKKLYLLSSVAFLSLVSISFNVNRASAEVGKHGFYRVGNQDSVYRVYNKKICKVRNREQMNAYGGFAQVRSAASPSVILNGRNFVGECSNP